MPYMDPVRLGDTYMLWNCQKTRKSNWCGDEVEIELFDAGREPSIEAEAPLWLAGVGRKDMDQAALGCRSCTSREQRMTVIMISSALKLSSRRE